MAATLARGVTTIEQAACEPEIVDLCDCLVSMGAKISGQGSPMITVEGVDELHGAEHPVIPDRIEAGTYVLAGGPRAGGGPRRELRTDTPRSPPGPDDRGPGPLLLAARTGSRPRPTTSASGRPAARTSRPTPIRGLHGPAGPVDGAPRGAEGRPRSSPSKDLLGQVDARGSWSASRAQLRRQNTAVVVRRHPGALGVPVMASDLRASAALVMAGLVARGTTEVHRVYHIDRGYEAIEERLQGIGAAIRREAE